MQTPRIPCNNLRSTVLDLGYSNSEIIMQDVQALLRARWCEPTLSIVDVRNPTSLFQVTKKQA